MAGTSIEERLATLEQEVAQLKQERPVILGAEKSANWLEQWFGAFKDNPDFDAAMERGAEYRRSQPTAADEQEAHVSA